MNKITVKVVEIESVTGEYKCVRWHIGPHGELFLINLKSNALNNDPVQGDKIFAPGRWHSLEVL